jgi:hypothetical protein
MILQRNYFDYLFLFLFLSSINIPDYLNTLLYLYDNMSNICLVEPFTQFIDGNAKEKMLIERMENNDTSQIEYNCDTNIGCQLDYYKRATSMKRGAQIEHTTYKKCLGSVYCEQCDTEDNDQS